LLQDAALAQTGAHRDAFWHLRHSISEAEKLAGAGIKNDISVPLSRMAEFLSAGGQLMSDHAPGARIVAFGHLGDGNLHFNLAQPPGTDPEDFMALRETVSQAINTIAVGLGGSFSAEHGIGSLKCDELARLSGDVELDLMRAVKNAIDPAGIMNPGKIFPIIDA
jgi:FAD/FMN-containing dehydrogenase